MDEKKSIILVGGCFDVLHPGHIEFLKKAKELGGKLVLLLESDTNIRKLKGENRPLNKQKTRTENLFKTGLVDIVIPLASKVSDTYYENIVKSINPDIIAVTKGDPLIDKKNTQAKSVGGKLVEVMDRDAQFSTTKIVDKK